MAYAAPRGASMRDRIHALSVPEPNTGCWLWTAGATSDGHVQADCPFCGKTFECDLAVVAPEIVRLKKDKRGGIIDAVRP